MEAVVGGWGEEHRARRKETLERGESWSARAGGACASRTRGGSEGTRVEVCGDRDP